MYSRRLSQPLPNFPNLKRSILENIANKGHVTCMIRHISTTKNMRDVKQAMDEILKHINLCEIFKNCSFVPRSFKHESKNVLRIWAHQCECVLAQRLRRGQQMFSLYSKLWEERALREFVTQVRQRICFRSRNFLLGALGVSVYNWQANRIPENEIKKHSKELDYIYLLKEKTLCDKCSKNSSLCPCKKGLENPNKPTISTYDEWKVFVEKNDLVVWRRPHSSGNYEYKVYGSYSDVTAEDFLNVQIDIGYRKQWDNTAVTLNVVETDPDPTSHSDIVYWEMLWPTLFANRDYVFNRRYMVDYKSKTLFLISKSTSHPNCPKDRTKYRIEDYWSYMVIRPYTELNNPGIEFSLTYFDNPGVNIPASITTWVAMKAMPDFLERLREASRKYKKYCQDSGLCQICNITDFQEQSRFQFHWDYFDNEVTDNTIYEAQFKIKSPTHKEATVSQPSQIIGDSDGAVNNSAPPAPVSNESHSFWRFIKRLFR